MLYGKGYGETSITESFQDPEAFDEAVFITELLALPEDEFNSIMESEGMKVLEEKGVFNRKTIVRLKKDDDLNRRDTMAALQLAKEADDPLWERLSLNRVKERDLLSKIKTKYGSRAARVAKTQQRDYMKMIRQGGTVKTGEINNRQ